MASPAASTSNQSGGSGKKAEALDDLLNRLGIEDDEIDDLVFEEEESAPKEGIKWMALVRVHTSNYFSPQAFEQNMKVAWSPAKEVRFQHLEENLFTVQCFCLGDWIKVEQGGPWLFRQNAVCIEKYDGLSPTESVDLNYFDAWIQIHKLPVGYRNDALIRNLTQKKIGKVISTELKIQGQGNFVRVRVKLDVRKVLARFVTISREGQREFYQVMYEKFPKFCGACGFLGHSYLECGSGEHDINNLKWGDFLKADWSTWHGRAVGGNRGRGRGSQEGRGSFYGERDARMRDDVRGRGRGNPSWRHNALPLDDGYAQPDDELEDTLSSPIKEVPMETEDQHSTDSGVKRRLLLTAGMNTDGLDDATIAVGDMMAIDRSPTTSAPPESAAELERKKRSKKAGANSPSLGSAGSCEESVRSQ
jgi:hypothetical protein